MSDLTLATTEAERAELARLAEEWAEESEGWYEAGFLGENPCNPEDEEFIVAANPPKIAALLADHAALLADNERLRERAEVAEKALELDAHMRAQDCQDCPLNGRGNCPAETDREDYPPEGDCEAAIVKHFEGKARAALGLPAQAEGGEYGMGDSTPGVPDYDTDYDHPWVCDCCGEPMMDDTEIGCGRCYPCQAKIAAMNEEAPDET